MVCYVTVILLCLWKCNYLWVVPNVIISTANLHLARTVLPIEPCIFVSRTYDMRVSFVDFHCSISFMIITSSADIGN